LGYLRCLLSEPLCVVQGPKLHPDHPIVRIALDKTRLAGFSVSYHHKKRGQNTISDEQPLQSVHSRRWKWLEWLAGFSV
jgi:hypothetical protein